MPRLPKYQKHGVGYGNLINYNNPTDPTIAYDYNQVSSAPINAPRLASSHVDRNSYYQPTGINTGVMMSYSDAGTAVNSNSIGHPMSRYSQALRGRQDGQYYQQPMSIQPIQPVPLQNSGYGIVGSGPMQGAGLMNEQMAHNYYRKQSRSSSRSSSSSSNNSPSRRSERQSRRLERRHRQEGTVRQIVNNNNVGYESESGQVYDSYRSSQMSHPNNIMIADPMLMDRSDPMMMRNSPNYNQPMMANNQIINNVDGRYI